MTLASLARGARRAALPAALTLVAVAAAAAPSRAATVPALRGPQQPAPASGAQLRPSDRPAPQARAAAPASAEAGASLSTLEDPAPRFTLDAAPRISGLPTGAGGAQCRQSCAQDRYQCRSIDLPERCDGAWSQCVAACPEASASPL